MAKEQQMSMFDEVKMEATEKKHQPLYTPTAEDVAKARGEEAPTEPHTEPYTMQDVNTMDHQMPSETIIMTPTNPEKEEELYDEPMHQGVDGVWYPESEWTAPISEGGPTRQEVEEWKSKYKRIYFLPFEEGIYIFRTLKRPEYKEIIRNAELSAMDREELFAERCILFPRDFTIAKANETDAGIVSVLSDAIMEKSGFMAQTGIIKL